VIVETLVVVLVPLLLIGMLMPAGGTDVSGEPDPDIIGTPDDDTLLGTDDGERIHADAGNDVVRAGAGDDWVEARFGDDLVLGEDGDDLIFGGHGTDLVYGGAGNDTIWLGDEDDQTIDDRDGPHFGGESEGNFAGDDKVTGGDGRDYVIDWVGSNTLRGDLGNDRIIGLDGNGTDAPDSLEGGWGHDHLTGDDGDTLLGGEYDDHFDVVLNETDDAAVTILDFDSAVETLHLAIDQTVFAGATKDDLSMAVDPDTGDVSVYLKGLKLAHLVDPAGEFSWSNVLLPAWIR
jgi:Ca2+-binding RTX toxin-like protein